LKWGIIPDFKELVKKGLITKLESSAIDLIKEKNATR